MDVKTIFIQKWNVNNEKIPENFNWNENKYGITLAPVRHQGACGSCWAIACADVVYDRRKIFEKQLNLNTTSAENLLSPQHLLTCSRGCVYYQLSKGCNDACDGGFVPEALRYAKDHGLPFETEISYVGNGKDTGCDGIEGACTINPQTICRKIPSGKVLKTDKIYQVNLYDTFGQLVLGDNKPIMNFQEKELNMRNIQYEIMKRGPVCAIMNLFSNFNKYWRDGDEHDVYDLSYGVDRDTYNKLTQSEKQLGSLDWLPTTGPGGLHLHEMHAIAIVGWGVSPKGNKPYWLIRNSWGESNALRGYIKVARGNNTLGIESSIYACWWNDTNTNAIYLQESSMSIKMFDNNDMHSNNHLIKNYNAKIRYYTMIFLLLIFIIGVFAWIINNNKFY
jgi:hypothetical protein